MAGVDGFERPDLQDERLGSKIIQDFDDNEFSSFQVQKHVSHQEEVVNAVRNRSSFSNSAKPVTQNETKFSNSAKQVTHVETKSRAPIAA